MIDYNLVETRKTRVLTVFYEDGGIEVVPGDHPHFEDIISEIHSPFTDESKIRNLADLSIRVAERFRSLSERVSVANGRVYFDGDETSSTITRQIVRFLDLDVDDWKPLVAFMEKIASNPNDHSREQLFDWLDARDFTIRPDGDLVGYKGVTKQADGTLVSGFSGKATVDGTVVTGQIPNAVGSEITMPRTSVAHDPSAACSTGLHVGNYEYARAFAHGALLKVAVNPRDVVSVPTDGGGDKVRVCRYRVLEVIDAPETEAVDATVYNWDYPDEYDPYGSDYDDESRW